MATVRPIQVPGKWIPARWDPVKGYIRRKYQPGHYALPGGRWVPKPTAKPTTTKKTTTTTTTKKGTSYTPGTYTGLSDAEINARANAAADAQLAAQSAAIQRQQAAAAWQAQRDEATMGQLGQAQMGMISQIPANVQNVYNTAAQAMSQWGTGVAGQAAAQQQGEQAAGAAAVASQVGDTARAATPGLDPGAAAAATAAIGGTIPAQRAISEGASTGAYAAGMPAVVARATQDQVAMRIADAATEDAGYRQQLIDLAATRGGVYNDALNNIYDIESKKFGQFEATERLKLDQYQFEQKQKTDAEELKQNAIDVKFKRWLSIQQLVLAGKKLSSADKKWMMQYGLEVQRVSQGQQRIDETTRYHQQQVKLANTRNNLTSRGLDIRNQSQLNSLAINKAKLNSIDAAQSKVAGHLVNKAGKDIKDANGRLIPLAPGATSGGKKGGVKLANQMAGQFRGSPRRNVTQDGVPGTVLNEPKVSYASGVAQIRDALMGKGYPRKEADAIAHNAMNAHYGPGVGGRPKKKKKK